MSTKVDLTSCGRTLYGTDSTPASDAFLDGKSWKLEANNWGMSCLFPFFVPGWGSAGVPCSWIESGRSARSTWAFAWASLRSLDGRGGRRYMGCGAVADSRFLHYAVAVAPTPVGMTRSETGKEEIKGNVKGNGQECPFHTGVASLLGRPRRPSPRELFQSLRWFQIFLQFVEARASLVELELAFMNSRILVSGVSGPIGTALLPSLRTGGWSVVRLVRGGAAGGGQIAWDPARPISPEDVSGFDAVIHLAGETIVGRWTCG